MSHPPVVSVLRAGSATCCPKLALVISFQLAFSITTVYKADTLSVPKTEREGGEMQASDC